MRSNRGIFWYSLGLTLLLLLPMVLTVAFFTDQYQKQQLLRQASAADSTLHIEPQQTVTLCALPGSLRVSAPSGTTTLAECALSAGAGRAAQLLVGTVATGETAAPALHYIAATPATWADCAGRTASARIDTASLLDAAARTRLGYGEDPIAVCTAAQASELIALLAGLPDGLRSRSARLLTDLLAADLNALGETLTYLSARTALTIDYTTAAVAAARGGVQLTEEGMAAVCALLL